MRIPSLLLALFIAAASAAPVATAQNAGASAEKPAATSPKKGEHADITLKEFDKLSAGKDVIILDVRTPEEYKKGHIKGAKHIDWFAKDFASQVSKLDKDKAYIVHCASGRRSAQASQKMAKELGFTKVYNLEGGFNAWEEAGKPVEK